MRVPGHISPTRAAELLGLHRNTVIGWCQRAVAGESSPLHEVKQFFNGYYWIPRAEIESLLTKLPGSLE